MGIRKTKSERVESGIILGRRYRDEITGFVGTATGITEFLYGCHRVGLQGVNAKGDPADFTFDAPQLRLVDDEKPALEPKQRTGGPKDMVAARDAYLRDPVRR